MHTILLVEDDLSLIDGLSYSLRKQGFAIDIARTVSEAFCLLNERQYDLLILDISLPDGSGFDICEKVRKTSNVPIMFLTASDEEVSVIMGLDMGGDDYITKPFKLGILVSRIHALLRRAKEQVPDDTEITSNGITLFRLQGRAYQDDAALDLTAAEYKLLCLFMQNPGIILTKDGILDTLWDAGGKYVDDNTLAVYVRRLRTKIEKDPGNPRMLVTVRGMGYKWDTI